MHHECDANKENKVRILNRLDKRRKLFSFAAEKTFSSYLYKSLIFISTTILSEGIMKGEKKKHDEGNDRAVKVKRGR